MITANFICPFDLETRQTTLPVDADGNLYPMDWVHLTHESDNGTIIVQVRADDAIIQAMKDDDTYLWLEDILPAEEKPVQADPVTVKDWVTGTLAAPAIAEAGKVGKLPSPGQVSVIMAAVQEQVDKMGAWNTFDEAIERTLSLYGQTMDQYKQSGLG